MNVQAGQIPLTAEETAVRLRVHRNTVLAYLRAGKIRRVRLGNKWRITEEALAAFLNGESST